jgi:FADH2 O2-dependent halogenase
MVLREVDVVVLGSGFSGSLMAQILCSMGRSVALVDRGSHPRFAIGESSTPSANMILDTLARRYGLEEISPFSRYGTWQESYPKIGCGMKRGFSYFQHQPGEEFQVGSNHENELLVAGSNDDSLSDTHWLRADVDAAFCQAAVKRGALLLQDTEIIRMDYNPAAKTKWQIEGATVGEPVHIKTEFVVDATGAGGVLKRFLQIPDQVDQLQTHTSAIYGHFHKVSSWHDQLAPRHDHIQDYPFCCDHSAQHHLLEGSWLWMLRFNQGLTSVGLVMDQSRPGKVHLAEQEHPWESMKNRYPDLGRMLQDATLADPPGKLLSTGRLQRLSSQAAGRDWAMLPHAAGFIDPLHSTGIAHTLSGVERLARILEQSWGHEDRITALQTYQQQVLQELVLIDRLVAGCYRAMNHFPWFVSYSMLYFIATVRYELDRLEGSQDRTPTAFLGADQADWTRIVSNVLERLENDLNQGDSSLQQAEKFRETVWKVLKPFDRVGLSSPEVHHMYPHTATW